MDKLWFLHSLSLTAFDSIIHDKPCKKCRNVEGYANFYATNYIIFLGVAAAGNRPVQAEIYKGWIGYAGILPEFVGLGRNIGKNLRLFL